MCAYSLAVIIPNYNKEKYLRECLDSVISQTYQPDEIIVVDDVSTDNSREIIKEYAEEHTNIKPLFLEKNGGVSKARNAGLAAAKSEYVTFLDSDDFYFIDRKLENEMKLIEKYRQKGIDIVSYSPTVLVEDNGDIRYIPVRHKAWYIQGNVYMDLIAEAKKETIPRDFVMKKSIVEEVGAYSFHRDFYEDLDFSIRLAAKLPYYCTLDYGTAYRQVPVGLSNKDKKDDHIATINEIKEKYKKDMSVFDRFTLKVLYRCWRIERYPLRLLRKFITGI